MSRHATCTATDALRTIAAHTTTPLRRGVYDQLRVPGVHPHSHTIVAHAGSWDAALTAANLPHPEGRPDTDQHRRAVAAEALQEVAGRVDMRNGLTMSCYDRHRRPDQPASRTIIGWTTNWVTALAAAGLASGARPEGAPLGRPGRDQCRTALRDLANTNPGVMLTVARYEQLRRRYTHPAVSTILRRYPRWSAALTDAGLV